MPAPPEPAAAVLNNRLPEAWELPMITADRDRQRQAAAVILRGVETERQPATEPSLGLHRLAVPFA